MILRQIILVLVTVVFASAIAFSDVIKEGTLQAASDGVDVNLRWITEDESGVILFEIERRAGTEGAFVKIGQIDPKGPSLYEFVDHSAFMKITSLYQYRIKISFSDVRVPYYTNSLTVAHTVSGVRRTWGSIKAMFR